MTTQNKNSIPIINQNSKSNPNNKQSNTSNNQIDKLNKSSDKQVNPNQSHILFNIANKTSNSKNQTLKIIHWNCRSIYKRKSNIIQFLDEEKPDILLLNEINCQDHIINMLSHLTNYSIEAKCRTNKGGGVCLFIKEKIDYNLIKTPNNIEILGVQININNEKINIYT